MHVPTRVKRHWFAIVWFNVWALFQTFAVVSVLAGKWRKPDAFPDEPYFLLIYADMLFIPVYYAAAILLMLRRPFGYVWGLLASGAMIYVLIYLLALSHLRGAVNVTADSVFLLCTLISVLQLVRGLRNLLQYEAFRRE